MLYEGLNPATEEGKRTAARLLSLKSLMAQSKKKPGKGSPRKTLDATLLLATWNIRELGNNQKYGARLPEALHYIAEIIRAYDVVAVQEVNEDVTDLNRVMALLGSDWKYLLTDITLGRQGNGERMAFVYDSRKVRFDGLAGQVIIPPGKKKGTLYDPARQLARAPMMVGFRSGWFRFTICTTHILYGGAIANHPQRILEIKMLAEQLAGRASSPHAWAPNMVLLGDFNIFHPEDQTAQALKDAGFFLPPQLAKLEAGEAGKHYDQIAFYSRKYGKQQNSHASKALAGVVRFFDKVFTDDDEALYARQMGKGYTRLKTVKARTTYYRAWRTFQMSDHRPMWIELPVDFSRGYLAKVMRGEGKALAAEPARAPAGEP